MWPEAGAALDTVTQIAQGTTPADQAAMTAGEGENKKVIDIAMHALMGEIAFRHGQLDQAEQHFRQAATIEDSFNYIEPPQWYYPLRWSLGAILLKAGKAAQAETVYREDLRRFPENGWSLYGLAASLRAQGKTAEAAEVEQHRSNAWRDADITLTATHF
jgi:Flp pilus assembly protein TadD